MGTHATQRTSPWADWRSLDVESRLWLNTGGDPVVLTAANFAADQADLTASTGIAGGATPKVTFARAIEAVSAFGYVVTLKIPDFAVGRDQAQRLASWDGLNTPGSEMGDGGRRIALQVENVLSSVSTSQGVQTIGTDLNFFAAGAKYKGFGAKAQVADGLAEAGDDAEDAIVCPDILNPAGTSVATAFPDLSLPSGSESVAPSDPPTFSPNGMCRIQTIFDLPNTIMPGTIVECSFIVVVPARGSGAAGVAVQWPYASYRWLIGGPGSYPANIGRNASAQLLGPTATYPNAEYDQPYFDDGVEEP